MNIAPTLITAGIGHANATRIEAVDLTSLYAVAEYQAMATAAGNISRTTRDQQERALCALIAKHFSGRAGGVRP